MKKNMKKIINSILLSILPVVTFASVMEGVAGGDGDLDALLKDLAGSGAADLCKDQNDEIKKLKAASGADFRCSGEKGRLEKKLKTGRGLSKAEIDAIKRENDLVTKTELNTETKKLKTGQGLSKAEIDMIKSKNSLVSLDDTITYIDYRQEAVTIQYSGAKDVLDKVNLLTRTAAMQLRQADKLATAKVYTQLVKDSMKIYLEKNISNYSRLDQVARSTSITGAILVNFCKDFAPISTSVGRSILTNLSSDDDWDNLDTMVSVSDFFYNLAKEVVEINEF